MLAYSFNRNKYHQLTTLLLTVDLFSKLLLKINILWIKLMEFLLLDPDCRALLLSLPFISTAVLVCLKTLSMLNVMQSCRMTSEY